MMSPPKETHAGRREWIGLAVLALPCVVCAMDLTVLIMAVPSLSADLKPTSAQLLWIVDIYGFILAGSLMTMGTLGDRIGRRRLLLIGAGTFGIDSVLAAFSTSAGMLIATRALLGLAGATVAPSTLSLIRNMFLNPRERSVAIGVWISSYSVGTALGPLVGGMLLEHFRWGSVFLLGVPVMALLLVLGPVLLPEFTDPEAGRMDIPSAALSLAGVLLVIYGLKQIAQGGVLSHAVLSIVAGFGVGLAFVRRQRQLTDPLIDLRLFQVPAFSASLAMYTLATFVGLGMFVFVSQYLQLVLGLSPLHAGLWTMPFDAAFIVGSLLTPAIARRIRATSVIAGGLTLAAVGFGVLTQTGGPAGVLIPAAGLVLYALGLAPVFTLATDLIVGNASPERAGAVSAMSETGSEFGGALGIAVLGSLGTAVYRSAMARAVLHGVPAEAAATVRDTLEGAVTVAGRLSDPLGPELLGVARCAFTQALQWTAIVSTAVTLAAAIASAILLKHFGAGTVADRDIQPAKREETMTVKAIGNAGVQILRYGLVFMLVVWGAAKFTAFEAVAILPLIEHSPFLAWLYPIFGSRGTSALFGVIEMLAGVLIATRRWLPRVSGYASLAAAGIFVITLSFLFTTPGVLEPTNPSGGFLMKDIELLGAALFTFAEALLSAREPRESVKTVRYAGSTQGIPEHAR